MLTNCSAPIWHTIYMSSTCVPYLQHHFLQRHALQLRLGVLFDAAGPIELLTVHVPAVALPYTPRPPCMNTYLNMVILNVLYAT
jgi:hypothetical protein